MAGFEPQTYKGLDDKSQGFVPLCFGPIVDLATERSLGFAFRVGVQLTLFSELVNFYCIFFQDENGCHLKIYLTRLTGAIGILLQHWSVRRSCEGSGEYFPKKAQIYTVVTSILQFFGSYI